MGWFKKKKDTTVQAVTGVAEKAVLPGKARGDLSESESRYRALFERVPVGLYRTTPDGRILDANPALVRMLQYPSRDDLLRKNAFDLFVNPEERQRERALLDQSGVLKSVDLQLRRYDGSVIWVRDSVQSVKDAENRVIAYEGSLEDITEQKRAEAEVSFLASIVESSEDAIIGETLDGIILSWNAAAERIYGYFEAEALGQSVAMLIMAGNTDELVGYLEKVRRGERVEHFETQRVSKDGRPVDVSLTISPIRNLSGEIIGISKIARDITRHKQMEKRLLRTERLAAMGQLAANLAHEIKNPLQSIEANLELIMDFPLEPGERLECLEICRKEIERLREITQSLLAFARTERYSVHPVSFPQMWEQTLGLLRLSLEKSSVQVITDFPEDLPLVLGVADQIVQVLLNLALNSLEAMPGGGDLKVKASLQGDQVVVTLTNSGPPIPEEHLERVFDPYFTTKVDGSGLGLFICHNIVQQHGGTLVVENLPDRCGVIYSFNLPAIPPDLLSKAGNGDKT